MKMARKSKSAYIVFIFEQHSQKMPWYVIKSEVLDIFYSYNTLTRDMTKIYARFTRARSARVRVRIFSHIPSDRVISVMFYTPVDENDYR